MTAPSIVALIPARQGSKRVVGKNIRPLAGHPLLAYTIAAAKESDLFTDIIVSTDSPRIADIAKHYGANVPFLRPQEMATDHSADIAWLYFTLNKLQDRNFDCFSILRPTSPFRSAATIRRAWKQFCQDPAVDSLRAVEKCTQHPGKMWVMRGDRLLPLFPFGGSAEQPWHSTPYQALPPIYVQNASLEIAWTDIVLTKKNIAGETILPFLTDEVEGFDINSEYDWAMAEQWLATGKADLPKVLQKPFADLTKQAA